MYILYIYINIYKLYIYIYTLKIKWKVVFLIQVFIDMK